MARRIAMVVDPQQEQLADEILASVTLAVQEGRCSMSAAEGALQLALMRLECVVADEMGAKVDREMGDDDEEDVNAFLRRPREDGDANG